MQKLRLSHPKDKKQNTTCKTFSFPYQESTPYGRDALFFVQGFVLSHTFRLRSRDVRYLTKKRNYFVKGWFGFFYVPQYANRPFNQFSCHITIKLSKYATKRNLVKRLIMNLLRDTNAPHLPLGNQFYKVFIMLNKNELPRLQTLLQQKGELSVPSSSLKDTVTNAFQSSFTSFQSFLCSRK